MVQLNEQIEVGLFTTCLVDVFRPSVGFASLKLLEDSGCKVHVPVPQTCCGQTAWNAEDREDAQDMAIKVIKSFEPYDYVIAPSQTCADMLCKNYPALFRKDPTWKTRSDNFASKVFEITHFLETVMKIEYALSHKKEILTGTDLASLMHMASKIKKQGNTKQIRHVTEVMADMLDTPSIGGTG